MRDQIEKISAQMKPFLAGHDPEIQAAVIADLFATWLAGLQGPKPEIDAFRKARITEWLKLVRQLVPLCEKEIKASRQ